MWRRVIADYGMVLVLLVIGGVLSVLTFGDHAPSGAVAIEQIAHALPTTETPTPRVLVVLRDRAEDVAWGKQLGERLSGAGVQIVETVHGGPAEARQALDRRRAAGETLDAIVADRVTAAWSVIGQAQLRVVQPRSYRWPTFLKVENLLNVANQIAVIAILAVGMTLVIITGGIDLSVGSLIALSSVVAARLIRDCAGAEAASSAMQGSASLVAILLAGAVGALSGLLTTGLRMPSFIVTLAMMLIARGSAYRLSDGQSINQIPEAYVWLGRGADLAGVPNSVVLMLLLYGAAHLLMTRTILGRYLYAVGGNAEAARLSGVPVERVRIVAFTFSGALAGLGGVVLASQLKSGAPVYGLTYELSVIAAVVVGGTSLSGGEGHIFGTLLGALVIAVIQNGMNLLNIPSDMQDIVLGLVILAAVGLDRLRRTGATHA